MNGLVGLLRTENASAVLLLVNVHHIASRHSDMAGVVAIV